MSIQNIYLYIMFYIFTHRSENHQGLSLVVAMLLKNIPSTLIASNKHWGFIPLKNVDGEMLYEGICLIFLHYSHYRQQKTVYEAIKQQFRVWLARASPTFWLTGDKIISSGQNGKFGLAVWVGGDVDQFIYIFLFDSTLASSL